MIRTQVSFTEEQMARVRERAARRGVSMAQVVRDAVDAALDADPDDRHRAWDAALAAIGSHRAGDEEPAARRHDEHLARAYADEAAAGSRRR